MRRAKFEGVAAAVPLIAELMLDRCSSEAFDVDVITWVPSHPDRRAWRGFELPRLIACELASQLHLPAQHALCRVDAASQRTRSRIDRLQHTPEFIATQAISGCRWLLIDDVRATGATLDAARRTLVAAGASEVLQLACVQRMRHNAPSGASG